MIQFCTCTRGSASIFESRNHQEASNICQNCGCKLSGDSRGALLGSMPSTIVSELSRAIDPHLNWKASTRGRRSAVRRARTSFTGGVKQKSTAKSSKASEGLSDKDLKGTGDMSVSESEKLGVSILGRRFSDALGSVPIKKRRLLFVRSPSPPHQSSSHSDDSDLNRERQFASYGEASSVAKQQLDIKSGIGTEACQTRVAAEEKTNLKDDTGEKSCDNADFSGISILAAVAIMNAEGSVSKNNNSQAEDVKCAESHCLNKGKEEQVHKNNGLDGKVNTPLEVCTDLPLLDKGSVGSKLDGPLDSSMRLTGGLQNVSNETGEAESSRNVKFCWDLNTVMDGYESQSDVVPDSKSLVAANIIIGEGSICDENLGSMKHYLDQAEVGDINPNIDLDDPCENHCLVKDAKMQEKPDDYSNSSVPDDKEGKNCFSRQHGGSLEDVSVEMVDNLVSIRDTSVVIAPFKEEKIDACCVSSVALVENKLSSPLAPCDATVLLDANPEDPMDHSCQANVQLEQCAHSPTPQSEKHVSLCADSGQSEKHVSLCADSGQSEKHVSLCADSGMGKHALLSVASPITEKASDVMVDGNICKDKLHENSLPGESEYADDLDGTDNCLLDNCNKARMRCLPDFETFSSQAASVCDELSSGSADAGGTQNNQQPVVPNETLNSSGDDYDAHIASEVPICSSAHRKSCTADVPTIDGDAGPHGSIKSDADGYGISPGQVALEDPFDCDYYSDASQIDTDQPAEMEKVECLGDDDSQYEDGEFRESVVNTWGEDENEEGESENVDYGSDNGGTDGLESASVPNHADRVEGRRWDNAGKEAQDCEPLSEFLPMDGDSGPGSEKKLVKDGNKNVESYAKRAPQYGTVDGKGDRERVNEGDASRRSSDLRRFRMKSSGWDCLPEVGSVSRKDTGTSWAASEPPLRRESLRRDLPSRVDGPDSSDASNRKDKSYVRSSRSSGRNDLDSRGTRDREARGSIGRGGQSLYSHARDNHDIWPKSPNRCYYYGPSSFSHQSSRNAAAAAVAKYESEGFVVTPDGTIVKAGSMGHSSNRVVAVESAKTPSHHSHMERRSSIERDRSFAVAAELGSSRETSPDRGRASRYSRVIVGAGNRAAGYHRLMPDDSIDASLPHQFTRREQCLSPQRRPLRRSRTRSPSRSRSRSPYMYPSPSGRNGNAGRLRSPHRRLGIRFPPPSRNHSSPPNASRWVDERKNIPLHFREHNRFSGRVKPNDYSRPMDSRKVPEFAGFDARPRYDVCGDGGGKSGYGSRVRQCDTNGNMKHFRYEDDFRSRNPPQLRPSKFSPRGRPRGIENQLADLSQRAKEEKIHVRYGRDGKHDTSFKSFGVRD